MLIFVVWDLLFVDYIMCPVSVKMDVIPVGKDLPSQNQIPQIVICSHLKVKFSLDYEYV